MYPGLEKGKKISQVQIANGINKADMGDVGRTIYSHDVSFAGIKKD